MSLTHWTSAALLAASCCSSLVAQPASIRLPRPAGPYPVGTVTYEWQDETRQFGASPLGSDLRTIVVQIWYPAENVEAPRAPYSALSADYRHVEANSELRPPFSKDVSSSPLVLISPGRGLERYGYTTMAEALASDGYVVAVFAFDQRGAGASGIDCGTTTFDDVVNDAEAAYRFVATHSAIDASRVGLKGGSAGAWTAQALAARAQSDASLPNPAFIATWIGPATSIEQQQRDCTHAMARRLGLSAEQAAIALRQIDIVLDEGMPPAEACRALRRIEAVAREEGWLEKIFGPDDFPGEDDDIDRVWLRRCQFDPTEVLRGMRDTPYLAVFGEEDDVVPVDVNTETLRSLLREAGNGHVRIVVVPGVGHATEHGDQVRPLPAAADPASDYKFDRVEPRYFECLVRFLRELGIAAR